MKRSCLASTVALSLLLAAGLWLTLAAMSPVSIQAQERVATPSAEQRPERGSGGGSGRRSGAQSGNLDVGQGRPAQPVGSQTEEAPSPNDAVVTADELSIEYAKSLGIVAIAGVDGARLTKRPQGETLVSVPLGTVMQATGRSEESRWLYIVRDAVFKGGVEVEPALAGWTPAVDVIAFSIENLPVVDAGEVQIILPDPSISVSEAGATESNGIDRQLPSQAVDVADRTGDLVSEEDAGANAIKNTLAITGSVNLDDARLNVRSGPSTATAIAGKLLPNESVTVSGRSEDAAWLLIAAETSSELVGWVAADFIEIDGDAETVRLLPVFTVHNQSPTSDVTSAATVSGEEATVGNAVARGAATGFNDLIVVQTSPGATFYAYNLESDALWPLTSGFDPAISPDGLTVAFTRDGGQNGIYLIDIDGGNERRIFAERGRLASPKWSPKGDWIVFSRGNTFAECYQLGRTCLTASQIRERNPNIDLGKLELVREPRYHLARVDSNGDNYTDVAALDTARAPDWIEAGIVYQSSAGLQITDISPDEENRLVIDDYLKPYFHDPDWQPGQGAGGGRIAYMGKEGSHWEIFTVNPDGSGVTALTRPATTLAGELPSNVAPAWSLDGSKIVFLSNRADNGGSDRWRLWVMDADGSNQRPLPVDLNLDYTFGDEQAVSW